MIKFIFLLLLLFLSYLAQAEEKKDPMTEVELVARTIHAEAGNQSYEGKVAVASVIWNRKHQREGRTWEAVVLRPRQFSCWNDPEERNEMGNRKAARQCLALAEALIQGNFKPSGPWTHYYNPKLAIPAWGARMTNLKVIGDHRFGVCK